MKRHEIPLASFKPCGNVSVDVHDGELNVTANTDFHRIVYAYTEDKFKIPFRVDITVKIDLPSLYLIIGKGHIVWAQDSNRMITDILGGENKPNLHKFDNFLPLNEYVDISVIYGTKYLWVSVGGKCRCLSKKDPYIKALKNNAIPDEFSGGFGFAVTCGKRTQAAIKAVTVTEYENDEPDIPAEIHDTPYFPPLSDLSGKPAIEDLIKNLSPEVQSEILKTDEYLMKNMKKSLKLKRRIETKFHPRNKIVYLSSGLLSCHLDIYHTYMSLELRWLSDAENHVMTALNKLAEESPEFADKMFLRVKECTRCGSGIGGTGCVHGCRLEYNSKKTFSCWGTFQFKMLPSDFEDFRKVMDTVNSVVKPTDKNN